MQTHVHYVHAQHVHYFTEIRGLIIRKAFYVLFSTYFIPFSYSPQDK